MGFVSQVPPVPNYIGEVPLYEWARMVHRWGEDNNITSVQTGTSTIYINPKAAPSIKFSVNGNNTSRPSVALWPVSNGSRLNYAYLVNVSWPRIASVPVPTGALADNTNTRLQLNSANNGVWFNGCSRVGTLQDKCAYTVLLHSTSTNVITMSCTRNTSVFWPVVQFMNGKWRPATQQYQW